MCHHARLIFGSALLGAAVAISTAVLIVDRLAFGRPPRRAR